MNRRPQFRFSLAASFGAMTLVALLAAEYQRPGWRTASPIITVGLIELIASLVCVEVLVRNIPSALAKAQRSNCIARGGRRSVRREKAEIASLQDLRWELQKTCLLLALGTNALLLLLQYEFQPFASTRANVSFFACTAIGWCTCVFGLLHYSYFDGLKHLAASIQFRAQQYHLEDLHEEAAGRV